MPAFSTKGLNNLGVSRIKCLKRWDRQEIKKMGSENFSELKITKTVIFGLSQN